jgi:hypothetical protein
MRLSAHSRNRLMQTFAYWEVPKEFAEPFYNYLVYGWTPGSCFTSVLANDFVSAISHSHPGNTVQAFKALVGWIDSTVPEEAHGSYEKVNAWCGINEEQRRIILEHCDLIHTKEQEVMLVLKGERTVEPHLY